MEKIEINKYIDHTILKPESTYEQVIQVCEEAKKYHTLEFEEDREHSRRLTVFVTRAIAIICCIGLFYIGYAQIKVVTSDTNIRTKYGSLGYCYLCGLETLRTCNCQYYDSFDKIDVKNVSLTTANDNIAPCPVKTGEGGGKTYNPINFSGFNLSVIR